MLDEYRSGSSLTLVDCCSERNDFRAIPYFWTGTWRVECILADILSGSLTDLLAGILGPLRPSKVVMSRAVLLKVVISNPHCYVEKNMLDLGVRKRPG